MRKLLFAAIAATALLTGCESERTRNDRYAQQVANEQKEKKDEEARWEWVNDDSPIVAGDLVWLRNFRSTGPMLVESIDAEKQAHCLWLGKNDVVVRDRFPTAILKKEQIKRLKKQA